MSLSTGSCGVRAQKRLQRRETPQREGLQHHACCGRFDKSTEKTVFHSLVVVGAGFSGLYAARLLRKQFPDLLVVEADNRIGGRVKPLEGLVSWPVQEGPECALARHAVSAHASMQSARSLLTSGRHYCG